MGPPLTRQKSTDPLKPGERERKASFPKGLEMEPFLLNNNFVLPLSGKERSLSVCPSKRPLLVFPTYYRDYRALSTTHSLCLVIGVFLILVGLTCFTLLPYLEDLIRGIMLAYTALIPGGPMFTAWFTPPILPNLNIHVFNITNPEEVLAGADPITVELGPYVYSAQHIRSLVQDEPSPSSLSFRARTLYTFLPELSAGSEEDTLTVLNMVMITGFNKVRSQLSFVKSTVVRPVLETIGRGEPVLTVTVGGFLFGYEDDLACITDGILGGGGEESSQGESTDSTWEDQWGEWEEEDGWRRRKRSIPSYRDPSGKCVWGILKDLNNTEHETIRINSGTSDYRSKGSIIAVDGKEEFGAWRENSTCDRFTGSIEPSTLPASLPSSFSLMVPVMCRKLHLTASSEESEIQGIPVTRYTAAVDSMKQDPCYCPSTSTPCLPDGYLHLEPCYPEISPPMAVSFPHGLNSPTNPLLTHTPSPNTSIHQLYMDINRDLGVPLAVRVSFQLSAVLLPDPSFPLLDSLSTTRLVPLFWASEGFSEPTPWMVSTTKLALAVPSLGSQGVAGGLLLLGLILTITTGALLRKRRRKREEFLSLEGIKS